MNHLFIVSAVLCTVLRVTACPLAQPTYVCQGNGKKCFLSISIPIAYHSRSATVSTGNKECSFEKSPRCSRRLPTSFFDAVAHFVGLPQEAQPNLTVGWCTVASQLSSPLPAPAHHCPVCGAAIPLQAKEQSKLIPSSSPTWRKVSGFSLLIRVSGFGENTHCVLEQILWFLDRIPPSR